MPTGILYTITVLVWSLTWLAIQYQLGPVPAAWSVSYRFGLAGLILLIFSILTRRHLHYSWRIHLALLLQGSLLFSFNFLLFYWGSKYLISGISAVIFATIVPMNIINARIFFKTPMTRSTLLGAFVGLLGLVIVFWHEIKLSLEGSGQFNELLHGAALCVAATFVASLGNMLSKALQTKEIPVLQANAFAMIYGFIVMAIFAMAQGQAIAFDFSPKYLIGLFYLTVFGSVIGFGCYLKLIGNIGPEKAAYVFVVVPVLALIVSTVAENFHWGIGTLVGVLFIVAGNCLILSHHSGVPAKMPLEKL